MLESDLARQLSAASDAFAVAKPAHPRRTDTLEIRSVEFLSLRGEAQLASKEVELFEIRFNRSAQSVGISSGVSDQLQVALHEMIENAIIHSECEVQPLAGYSIANGCAQFCVADVGIGVLASLRKCSDYHHIHRHKDAIRAALHDGTTRFGHQKGGFGFHEVFKALIEQWGAVRFRSGEGCISMNGSHLNADAGREHFPPLMAGFQASVACRAMAPSSVNPAT
jgi:anti-sigma regulatory factor (Ser/Thr protein kinase)